MLVCLMGPSGAGKSTLAKRIAAEHPELASRVPIDHFFSWVAGVSGGCWCG